MSGVLIADDDRVSCKLLAGLLTKWGYQAVAVHDGVAAKQELMKPDAPQLAILDWMMPGLDGIDVIRAVRAARREPYTYMLLLTSKGQKEDLLEGLEAGADDYLRKPFDPAELRARLRVGARIVGLITDGKEVEKANDLLVAIVDSSGDAIVSHTLDGIVTSWNKGAERLFGFSAEETIGQPITLVIPPDRLQEKAAILERLQRGEGFDHFETVRMRKDGTLIDISVTLSPITDFAGTVIGASKAARDITARKKSEAALREAERKYRGIFDEALFGIFQSTPGGRFLSVNAAMAGTFGYDSPEAMIASVNNIPEQLYVDVKRRAEFVLAMDEFGSVRNFECELFRKDGSKIWVSASARVIRENGAVVRYEGMNQDITERKRAERSLNLLRILMDQSTDAIEVIDPETLRFLDFNERACLNLGYSREELLARAVFDIDPMFDAASANATNEQLRKCGSAIRQSLHRRKDGSTFPVEVSIKDVQLDRAYRLCVVRDITERQQVQQQLLQAQKLESIGQLAAGIAHEINTPTQYIGDNVRFLKDAFQDLKSVLADYDRLLEAAKGGALSGDAVQKVSAAVEHADVGYLLEEIPQAIEQTLEGVTRVSALVSAMKEFSHPGTKEKTPVDLNHAIANTLTVARNEWKHVADLETDYDSSLPTISCLPGEFNQVILNLVVNAAHAIAEVIGQTGSEKGMIRVQTRNCQEWVEIRIQDTGPGIAENVRPRIFDPFFTTKEIGKGTGQGLAIARSVIVDKHGGTIHFETEEGKGTTFVIRIPHTGKGVAAKGVPA